MPDLADAALTALVLAFAAAFQGFIGFGFGILAMSGLTLSHDLLHAQGVVNLGGLVVTGAVAWGLRGHVLWAPVRRMLPSLVIGVALGVTALRTLDRELMVRLLGATVVMIAGWNLLRPRVRESETPFWDVMAGLGGGLLGGAFNTGGPPMIAHLYRRAAPPDAIKASIQFLFLTVGLCRAPIAMAQGLMGPAIYLDALVSVPMILLGLALGIWAGRRVDTQSFRRASWAALGALGMVLLLR